jgi:hypothetical protein
MLVMSLDNTLWLAYILTEVAVVGLLIYRRVWRLLPIFCIYCAWDVLSNAEGFATSHIFKLSYSNYIFTYLIQTVIDSALQFCVLVELIWSVLRPIRNSLPRFTFVALAALILALGAVIWPFAALAGLANQPANVLLAVHLQQTTSILRILLFLAMAGCSQVLSIGWRDRELQVATGLGVYSLVSVGVTMIQTHQPTGAHGAQYAHLNQFVVASFLCSLLYWVFSFSQKEAERREFTPQMQNLLLAVAGVARAERTALTASSRPGSERRDKQ